MRPACRTLFLAASSAALLLAPARAADSPHARLPFSDDLPGPPALPVPIDRMFKGELASFDGDRIALKWNWKAPEQVDDFESFIPVRQSLRGQFFVKDGKLAADGTAGMRLKLAFASDFEVHVTPSTLRVPHDLGIVLSTPGGSDDSIICLVQDVLFTRFDRAAGNTNMINKLGGIQSAVLGMTEFRYIARSVEPRIAPKTDVAFDVVRKGIETAFTITTPGGAGVTLRGKDTDTPYTRFQPGLYVSGGAADFGALTISGKIDAPWCVEHGVLPFVAGNLLHPANRLKPPEKKLAELVERYAKQDATKETDPKKLVGPEQIAPLVGDVKVPLVIRIRAAEALLHQDDAELVAERLASLLDSKDAPARTLAWQLLRGRLPWHFHYEVDAEPKVRRDAAFQIADWIRQHERHEEDGKVFVEGEWCSVERANEVRGDWAHAWELRSPRIRLRTDLPKEWADWYQKALEAEYVELVKLIGREPPKTALPLSVLVFKDGKSMADFCNANGYGSKASWPRFLDVDRNVGFSVFDKKNDGLANTMGQFAKHFHRFATGKPWPVWYDEGRAAWFGSSDYGTISFDGTTLKVGEHRRTQTVLELAMAARNELLPKVADVITRTAAELGAMPGDKRRLWFAQAWALHAWFVDFAPQQVRDRFAEWQSVMEKLETTPANVEDVGFREFMVRFAKDINSGELDRQFAEWVKGL